MRHLIALLVASVLAFGLFWVGARIAVMVSGGEGRSNDFTAGQHLLLCGHSVDSRHAMAGYDLRQWEGDRCKSLSDLDRCLLRCLERAGTVEIAKACYPECVQAPARKRRP